MVRWWSSVSVPRVKLVTKVSFSPRWAPWYIPAGRCRPPQPHQQDATSHTDILTQTPPNTQAGGCRRKHFATPDSIPGQLHPPTPASPPVLSIWPLHHNVRPFLIPLFDGMANKAPQTWYEKQSVLYAASIFVSVTCSRWLRLATFISHSLPPSFYSSFPRYLISWISQAELHLDT